MIIYDLIFIFFLFRSDYSVPIIIIFDYYYYSASGSAPITPVGLFFKK